MAKQDGPARGSWLMAEELLERGDPGFVEELRRISDADRLGTFAAKWLADSRPASRSLLWQYLALPLNAYRHEPLVKRLFKLAEQQGDDTVMAHFLSMTDRLIRRVRRERHRYDSNTREQWTEETIRVPNGTMIPRTDRVYRYRDPETGEFLFARNRQKHARMRLFSIHTRHYLRRRAWRYFRKLGKDQPQRYMAAITTALAQYTDEDVGDGLALIDNWGLVHALFHQCPALVAKSNGWTIAEGHGLGELVPAPIFEPLWQAAAGPLIVLMRLARSRPVRQWTIQMLRRHHPQALALLQLAELLTLVAHDDAEISQLAAEALRQSTALAGLSAEDWLKLLDAANPQVLSILSELMAKQLSPTAVSLEQTVRLACVRPIPVARLGLSWLRARTISTAAENQQLLGLCDAECRPIRAELLAWMRSVLSQSPHFTADWVLEMLDSLHEDVRTEGWNWFISEPRACHDVTLWQRLLESPYDDIKLKFTLLLEGTIAIQEPGAIDRSRLAPELVRFLWASVLLNIHRGGRIKPHVVSQIRQRLQRHPEEAAELLSILAVALRSIRGPEWRSGLAGVVQILESRPELESQILQAFPELKLVQTMV